MRVKVFDDDSRDGTKAIEDEMNEWLSANPDIKIIHVCASSSGESVEGSGGHTYTNCFVFYEEL
jgi:hypothetical protein